MKKISLFYLLACCMIIAGCNEHDDRDINNDPSNSIVFLQIQDSQGRDLLNPLTEGHIQLSDAHMYYEIDGIVKEIKEPYDRISVEEYFNRICQLVFNSSAKSEHGIKPGRYGIRMTLGYQIKERKSKEIIRWNSNISDIIECEWDEIGFVIKKVYINGKLAAIESNPTRPTPLNMTLVH